MLSIHFVTIVCPYTIAWAFAFLVLKQCFPSRCANRCLISNRNTASSMNHGAVRLFKHAEIGAPEKPKSIQEKIEWRSNAEISFPGDSIVTADEVVESRES